MPLDKIRAAHKGSVLAGSSVVVPQIEVHKIDGLRKWRTGQHAIFAKVGNNLLRGLNALVSRLHHLLCLAINAIN